MLKMEDTTAEIPVLICTTAIKLAQEIGSYLATKQVTMLRKPFQSRDLVNAVQSALQNDAVGIPLSESSGSDGSQPKQKKHSTG